MIEAFANDLRTNPWFAIGELLVLVVPGLKSGLLRAEGVFRVFKEIGKTDVKMAERAFGEAVTAGVTRGIGSALFVPIQLVIFPVTMALGAILKMGGARFLTSLLRESPVFSARLSGFFGKFSSFIGEMRFGDLKPEEVLARRGEAFRFKETADRLFHQHETASLKSAFAYFGSQLTRIDRVFFDRIKAAGEIQKLADLRIGHEAELLGQKIDKGATESFMSLKEMANQEIYHSLLRNGVTPEAIHGTEIGLSIKGFEGFKITEGVQQFAFDQLVYQEFYRISDLGIADIQKITQWHTALELPDRTPGPETVKIYSPSKDVVSHVERGPTITLSGGRKIEVTPIVFEAATLRLREFERQAMDKLFKRMIGGLTDPKLISSKLDRIGKVLFDVESRGKTLEILFPESFKSSRFAQYKFTRDSGLFNLFASKVRSFNEAFFSLSPVKEFWKSSGSGVGKTLSEPLEFSGTPEMTRQYFEKQMAVTKNYMEKVQASADKEGISLSDAHEKMIQNELEAVTGKAKTIIEKVKEYREEYRKDPERATKPTKPTASDPISDPIMQHIIFELVENYPGFEIVKDDHDTVEQIAFLYFMAERTLARSEGRIVSTALLQLAQGGGKTLGVLIGKKIAYDILLERNPDASFHDLIATSRDSLASAYFKEGSIESHVIEDIRQLGIEVKNISSKEIQNIETIAPSRGRSLFIVDNYNLKRLSLDLTKLHLEKEGLEPMVVAGQERWNQETGAGKDGIDRMLGTFSEFYGGKGRLEEIQNRIDNHYLNRVKDLVFDEIQEALADSDLIEGPGHGLFMKLDPSERAQIQSEIRGRIKVFEHLKTAFDQAKDPHEVIESVKVGGREDRKQHQFKEQVLHRVFNELKNDPDVALLGERGELHQFDAFAQATANALMYDHLTDYFIQRVRGADGEVVLRYSTGRHGVNQLETVFGNTELGTAVLIKEMVKEFRSRGSNDVVTAIMENSGALESIADSYLHHEFNRTTTLQAVAQIGLDKTTFITATSKANRETLGRLGTSIYEIQPEYEIAYGQDNVVEVRVPKGMAIEGAENQVRHAIEKVKSENGGKLEGLKIVITGEDGALLVDAYKALHETFAKEGIRVWRIRGEEGNPHITKRLEAIRHRFERLPEENFILVVPDFGAGSNLFGFVRDLVTGEIGKGKLKPTIIEMGLRGETPRQQLAARVGGTLEGEVYGRYKGRFVTIIDEGGKEFTDAERTQLKAIEAGKERSFFEDTSRRMDQEVDSQNIARVVNISPSHAEKRLMEHRIYERAIKGSLERTNRKSEVTFAKLKNFVELTGLFKGFSPLLPDFERLKLVEKDNDGTVVFTAAGRSYLQLMDHLIQFNTPAELKRDAEELEIPTLQQLSAPLEQLTEKTEYYTSDIATIALVRFEKGLTDPLTFVGARHDLYEAFNTAFSEIFKGIPGISPLTREELGALHQGLLEKLQNVERKGEISPFSLTPTFHALVLGRLEGALKDERLTEVERGHAQDLRDAIVKLSLNFNKTVNGVVMPKSNEEFMFTVMQIAAQYPTVSTLDLIGVMEPLLSHRERTQAGYTMDDLGQVVIQTGDLETLALPEGVLQRMKQEAGPEGIDSITVLRKGLVTRFHTSRNQTLLTVNPVYNGEGMVYQFGINPLQYKLEQGQLVVSADDIKDLSIAEIADQNVQSALLDAGYGRGLQQKDKVRIVEYGKGRLTETYYLHPETNEILHAKVQFSLHAQELAESLGYVFPKAKGLKAGEEITIYNFYQKNNGLVNSAVLAGGKPVGTVGVKQTTLAQIGDPSLYQRLLRHGVDPNQTVVIRTFYNDLGALLQDHGGEPIIHVSVIGAGNSLLPTSARHIISRAVTSQISERERKPGLLTVELDFQQKDPVHMRNNSPTGEIDLFGGQVSINYHPELMNSFENRLGYDPVILHKVGGVEETLHLFLSLLYRMNIHEFRGHLRFADPVLVKEVAEQLGLKSPVLTREILQTLLKENDALGIQKVASPKQPGLFEFRLPTGELLVTTDDEYNIAGLGEGLFANRGSYTIQTSERIAETLSGAQYRAVDSAARFMYFFGLNLKKHSPDKIRQTIESQIYQYGIRELDDYEFLVKDPVLKEEVKDITVKFSEANFKALKEQTADRLARFYGVPKAETSSTPPEPPRPQEGISKPIVIGIPALPRILFGISRALPLVNAETYHLIQQDYEAQKLQNPSSSFVRIMSIFFEGEKVKDIVDSESDVISPHVLELPTLLTQDDDTLAGAIENHLRQITTPLSQTDFNQFVALRDRILEKATTAQIDRLFSTLGKAQNRDEIHAILTEEAIPFESGIHATVIPLSSPSTKVIKILDHPTPGVNTASTEMYQALQTEMVEEGLIPPYTLRHVELGGHPFTVIEMEKVSATSGEYLTHLMNLGRIEAARSYLQQGFGLYGSLLQRGYFVDPDASDRFTKDTGLYQGSPVLLDLSNLTQDPERIQRSLSNFEAVLMDDLMTHFGEEGESFRPIVQLLVAKLTGKPEVATAAVAPNDLKSWISDAVAFSHIQGLTGHEEERIAHLEQFAKENNLLVHRGSFGIEIENTLDPNADLVVVHIDQEHLPIPIRIEGNRLVGGMDGVYGSVAAKQLLLDKKNIRVAFVVGEEDQTNHSYGAKDYVKSLRERGLTPRSITILDVASIGEVGKTSLYTFPTLSRGSQEIAERLQNFAETVGISTQIHNIEEHPAFKQGHKWNDAQIFAREGFENVIAIQPYAIGMHETDGTVEMEIADLRAALQLTKLHLSDLADRFAQAASESVPHAAARDGGSIKVAQFGDLSVEMVKELPGVEYLASSAQAMVDGFIHPEEEVQFREGTILLFGKEEAGRYLVTRAVPVFNYAGTTHANTTPDHASVAELIDRYAQGETKLIGVYHDHPPRRQLSNRVGPSREDNPRNLIPASVDPSKIVSHPIGIVGELHVEGMEAGQLETFKPTLDNVQLYTYRFDQADRVEVAQSVSITELWAQQLDLFAKDGSQKDVATPEVGTTLPQPAMPIAVENVGGVRLARRQEAVVDGSYARLVLTERLRGIPQINSKGLGKVMLLLNRNDRLLLDESIDRIALPDKFIRALHGGTMKPVELMKLLVVMSRILKSGGVDAIHINGINLTDIQELQNILENVDFKALPVTPQGIADFINHIERNLSTQLFVEQMTIEVERQV